MKKGMFVVGIFLILFSAGFVSALDVCVGDKLGEVYNTPTSLVGTNINPCHDLSDSECENKYFGIGDVGYWSGDMFYEPPLYGQCILNEDTFSSYFRCSATKGPVVELNRCCKYISSICGDETMCDATSLGKTLTSTSDPCNDYSLAECENHYVNLEPSNSVGVLDAAKCILSPNGCSAYNVLSMELFDGCILESSCEEPLVLLNNNITNYNDAVAIWRSLDSQTECEDYAITWEGTNIVNRGSWNEATGKCWGGLGTDYPQCPENCKGKYLGLALNNEEATELCGSVGSVGDVNDDDNIRWCAHHWFDYLPDGRSYTCFFDGLECVGRGGPGNPVCRDARKAFSDACSKLIIEDCSEVPVPEILCSRSSIIFDCNEDEGIFLGHNCKLDSGSCIEGYDFLCRRLDERDNSNLIEKLNKPITEPITKEELREKLSRMISVYTIGSGENKCSVKEINIPIYKLVDIRLTKETITNPETGLEESTYNFVVGPKF